METVRVAYFATNSYSNHIGTWAFLFSLSIYSPKVVISLST